MIPAKPYISVVIPTHNRQIFLQKCLESLLGQRYPKDHYEIIVVDDGSADDTVACVRLFQQKTDIAKVTYFYQRNKGPAAARNYGVSKASGEIIAFIDDDCIVSREWIESIASTFFAKPDIALCGTPPYSTEYISTHKKELKPWPEHYMKFEYAPANIISTNNCALYKSVFHEVGGFDESFTMTGGEDPDLIYKIVKNGYKGYQTSNLIAFHSPKDSSRVISRQARIFGLTDCIILKRYFPHWFVIDMFFLKALNKRKFYYFKNSPVTGYLRVDILKIFIVPAAIACFNLSLALALLVLLTLFSMVLKRIMNVKKALHHVFVFDFFYLCGHIVGGVKQGVLYI